MNTNILNRALANAFASDAQRKAAFAKMRAKNQSLDTRGPGAATDEDGGLASAATQAALFGGANSAGQTDPRFTQLVSDTSNGYGTYQVPAPHGEAVAKTAMLLSGGLGRIPALARAIASLGPAGKVLQSWNTPLVSGGVSAGLAAYREAHPTMDPRGEKALALAQQLAGYMSAITGLGASKAVAAKALEGTALKSGSTAALKAIGDKITDAGKAIGGKLPKSVADALEKLQRAYSSPRGALAGVQQGRTLRVLDDITIEEQRAMEAAQAREFATRPSRYSFDSPDPEFFRWYEYGGKARPKPLSDAELQAYMNNRTEHLLNRAAIVIANAITSPAQRRAMFAKAGNTTAATSPKTLALAGTVQTDRGMVRAQEVPFIEPMPPGSRGRMEQMPTVLPPGTRPPTIQPPATAIRLPGAPSGSGAVHADETPPRTGGTRRLPGAPSSSGATHADDVGRRIAQAFNPVNAGGGAMQPPPQQGTQQQQQTPPLLTIPDEQPSRQGPAEYGLVGTGKTFMKPGGRAQAATPQRGIDDMKNPGGRNKRISSLLDLADSTGPKKKKV